MKKKVHPNYGQKTFTCSCGNSAIIGSSYEKGNEIRVNVCSACHPLYTGKKRIIDVAGRVERFKQRLQKKG